jgi:hypothetical protein
VSAYVAFAPVDPAAVTKIRHTNGRKGPWTERELLEVQERRLLRFVQRSNVQHRIQRLGLVGVGAGGEVDDVEAGGLGPLGELVQILLPFDACAAEADGEISGAGGHFLPFELPRHGADATERVNGGGTGRQPVPQIVTEPSATRAPSTEACGRCSAGS